MKSKLKYLRALVGRHMTQEELARRVSASRQTINAIERNKMQPTYKLAKNIAKELQCPMEELFSD